MDQFKIIDGWTYKGKKAIMMDHPSFLAIFLPELGGLMWKLIHKKSGTNLLYTHKDPSVYGTMQSSYVQQDPIHDYFIGGWFEALPNAGYKYSSNGGPTYDLHGEIPYLPWKYSISKDKITFTVSLLRTPLTLTKDIYFTDNGLKIEEKLVNFGRIEVPFSWLNHPCFDLRTFSDSRVVLKCDKLETDNLFVHEYRGIKPGYTGKWPFVESMDGGITDLSVIKNNENENTNDTVYLTMNEGFYRLESEKLNLNLAISWDKRLFPYVWYWLANGGGKYPWYGTAHVFSLEFSTSYPAGGLSSQIKNGTAKKISAGNSIDSVIYVEMTDLRK